MNTEATTAVDATASDVTPAAAARRAKLTELAEQFEAMLLTQMLKVMRQSMLTDDSDKESGGGLGLGSHAMTETIDSALAISLSRRSRLGLADFIVRAFERQALAADAPAPPSSGPAAERIGDPNLTGVEPATSPALQPPGTISSGFGWRNDPISGRPRFHSGTDVKMAYGQDVQVAAGGRVASVGTRGAYGLTVVVDHGGGVETRYAHLSSAPVREGEAVVSGQVIAQSGNSGRSTGPHLHFEVLNNGEAVDPRSGAALLASTAAH
jgi:murein DD-endopeptidase MepM/ murein hydrolase activator NlpD